MSEFVDVTGIKKIRDGVFESADDDGFERYVSQRKMRQEISSLKSQINNIDNELANIKGMLKQLLKVS